MAGSGWAKHRYVSRSAIWTQSSNDLSLRQDWKASRCILEVTCGLWTVDWLLRHTVYIYAVHGLSRLAARGYAADIKRRLEA